ncbi:phospholipase D-like domain-containing protein [Candidatus Proelusimicrobium volucris]|uniref:phospholipase D-like domain-containing protein n=1 Tax=Candidatus Proelusimicrobium volucris TaxID=3416225 RepID=UPI003D1359E8
MDIFSLSAAGILYLLLQLCVTIHILLFKDDVKSSIGWIGLVWLTPLLGSIIYIMFGINRIKRKAIKLKNPRQDILKITGKNIEEIQKEIPPAMLQMLRLGHSIHPQFLALGNKVTPLINGDEAYPQMCAAIEKAEKEVLIESYIFNNDQAGQAILKAAQKAAQNGAAVKIIIDGVGLNYSRPNITEEIKKVKGAEFAVFLPSRKPAALPFVNLRSHRKIMVIDGHTAFFGGMNIAKENLLKTNPKEPVQDTTFKIEGPVISQIVRIFMEDWIFSRKKPFKPVLLKDEHYLPGKCLCRAIPDGPDGDYGKVELMVLGAINCATKNIKIVTPYFLPEENILTALELAAMRGIDTEIILPQKSNIFGMDWAMQANFNRLIKKGVKIYQQEPPFDHSKIMTADNAWAFIGSSNWDVRSFKLNFEANMEIIDKQLAEKLNEIIKSKKSKSVLAREKKYPFGPLLIRNVFKLLTPYY